VKIGQIHAKHGCILTLLIPAKSSSGQYSAKSAYDGMFLGAVQFRPWERIWQDMGTGQM